MEWFHREAANAAPTPAPTNEDKLQALVNQLDTNNTALLAFLKAGYARVQRTGGERLQVQEQTAQTVDQSWPFSVSWITKITNDGTDSIFICFDGETTVSSNSVFTLHAGETVQDLPIHANRIFVRSKSGAQSFRAWGIE